MESFLLILCVVSLIALIKEAKKSYELGLEVDALEEQLEKKERQLAEVRAQSEAVRKLLNR